MNGKLHFHAPGAWRGGARAAFPWRRFAAAVGLSLPLAAMAAYPDRPINMIIPFPAGAGTDLTGRLLARCMESAIPGAKFIISNRPGAGGEIAMNALTKAAPDGYTVGIVNTPGVVSLPIEGTAQFNLNSFTFLSSIVDSPGTLSVRADSDIKSIDDLIKAAKAQPGKITVGTQGVGSAGALSVLLLERAAGIKLVQVPYQGAAPASVALLSKVIDVTTANLDEALTFSNGQPWRILGVMSKNRMPQAPDVPTFDEAGYTVRGGSIRGFAAPKGLPPEVKQTLEQAALSCQTDPTFLKSAKSTFQLLSFMDDKTYLAALQDLDQQLRAVWAAAPWKN